MAKTARFTNQMPFVGTDDQFELMGDTEKRLNDSKAAVIRAGISLIYRLVDDLLRPGVNREALSRRAAEIVRRPEDFIVVRRSDLPADLLEREDARFFDTQEDTVLA